MTGRVLGVARAVVGALLLLTIALDTVLVGWLVFSATSARQWLQGALITIAVPGVLYLAYKGLDRLHERQRAPVGRHGR